MRYALALVFLVGCGDISAVMMDDGGGAGGSGGGAAGQGGTTVPASDGGDAVVTPTCNAPQASLNGRATYIMGSVAAVDPAQDVGDPYRTCGNFAAQRPGIDGAATQEVSVADGVLGGKPTQLMSAAAGGGGCVYVLRMTTGPSGPSIPCAVTLDYALPQ